MLRKIYVEYNMNNIQFVSMLETRLDVYCFVGTRSLVECFLSYLSKLDQITLFIVDLRLRRSSFISIFLQVTGRKR